MIRALLLLFILGIGACATAELDDIKISSIQPIGRLDARLDILQPFPGSAPPNELLLKIDFTSMVDFFMPNPKDTPYKEIYFCDHPKALVLLSNAIISRNTPAIRSPSPETVRAKGDHPKTPITYSIFVAVAWDSREPFESFDLWQHPEDICFRLVGGAYRPSDIVVVTKEAIAAALASLRKEDALRRCLYYGGGSYLPPPGQPCRFGTTL
jgi:hypothetical protein